MCAANDKSHVEAWKSLIELIKTVVSINSAVLAAMAGYYVLSDNPIELTWRNGLSPGLLVLSIVVASFGFGKSIRSIKTGISERWGVGLTNVSIFLLVAGIACIVFVDREKPDNMATVLEQTEKEARGLNLSTQALQSVTVVNSQYVIRYQNAAGTTTVTYSPQERKLVKLEKVNP
jgi:hypothetical protein